MILVSIVPGMGEKQKKKGEKGERKGGGLILLFN